MADSPRGVDHVDSMDSHDDSPKNPEKKKSRRPANTAFRQQRLKAWQPILTPKTVLPLFFTIGIIFAPIGGLLYWASSQVQEIRINYTSCIDDASTFPDFSSIPGSDVHTAFKSSNTSVDAQWAKETDVDVKLRTGVVIKGNRCFLRFNLPEDLHPPVLFYYYLTNFFQNHRRYVESFDADQLDGTARSWSEIHGSMCDPLRGDEHEKKPYYPCGLIANSLFNDSFSSPVLLNPPGATGKETLIYQMENNSNIAWHSDKSLYGKSKYKPEDVIPPPNWARMYPNNYTDSEPLPDLEHWEGFQVWMRTAGLPTFSKLFQRNDTDVMSKGQYQITIDYHFPTTEYKGTKSVLITTRTVMGGRNPFLGIAYIVVGGLCIILGAIFTVTHLIKPRKLGDHTYLSWNNAPASKGPGATTAMASGRDFRPAEA